MALLRSPTLCLTHAVQHGYSAALARCLSPNGTIAMSDACCAIDVHGLCDIVTWKVEEDVLLAKAEPSFPTMENTPTADRIILCGQLRKELEGYIWSRVPIYFFWPADCHRFFAVRRNIPLNFLNRECTAEHGKPKQNPKCWVLIKPLSTHKTLEQDENWLSITSHIYIYIYIIQYSIPKNIACLPHFWSLYVCKVTILYPM